MSTPTTLHLLRLTTTPQAFLSALSSSSLPIIYAGRPAATLIPAARTDASALKDPFDLVLLVRGRHACWAADVEALVRDDYVLEVRVPTAVLEAYPRVTRELNTNTPETPADKPFSSQPNQPLPSLPSLPPFLTTPLLPPKTPITMLNLLRFTPQGHHPYSVYAKKFAQEVGKRRGARVLLPGRVTGGKSGSRCPWDQIALVHYPSIWAFADMVGSDGYREINAAYRRGALQDTVLVCMTAVEGAAGVEGGVKGRL